jgi:hypothetical protein
MRYCGRGFTTEELRRIGEIIAQSPHCNRAQLSRLVCQYLGWYKPDGGLKEMSCRVAMLRMQADGLLTLPAPRNGNGNGRPYTRRSRTTDPGPPLTAPVHELGEIHLNPITDRTASHLWNEYVQRYHYLGYQPLAGAQLRYLAQAQGQTVALLGFGAAAWKVEPRDRWIGWSDRQRQERLHLIVNNARFLILPWIQCQNLASKLLGMVARRLADDWSNRHGYRPVLLETFVQSQRFLGTCYRSANWTHVGRTQGRGKLDRNHTAKLPRKEIWLYPLTRASHRQLCH